MTIFKNNLEFTCTVYNIDFSNAPHKYYGIFAIKCSEATYVNF